MRLLTKSRFKLGLECPNKLYYTNKKEYANSKMENPFLEALAKGGFQVEELARMNFPGGILINEEAWEYEKAWNKTQNLLQQENIIIYEAVFLFEKLFIRVDILVKKGNRIQLIEVKSKSFDPENEFIFIGKKGGMVSGWKPYLFDVAYQKYVMQSCFPDWKIDSYIMMADKTKLASIDGLNQLFRITKKSNDRTGVKVLAKTLEELGTPVLGKKNISEIVLNIENGTYSYGNGLGFLDSIQDFTETYINDIYKNSSTLYMKCNKCEFKTTADEKDNGLISGFEECFKKQHKWKDEDFERPSLFNIRGIHWTKSKTLFDKNLIFANDLNQDDIGFKFGTGKFSDSERAWIQIEKSLKNDKSIHIDKEGLKEEMEKWVYPLHFIDFETCTAALPFSKGRRPYEQIAFQFSHHMYRENGDIIHANEYINNVAGYFPNFDFIRELKKALEKDNGTIFRFHNHENNILNAIHNQLLESEEKDRDLLIDFIKSISHSTRKNANSWTGNRDMVDLWVIAKNFYFNPLTQGSNSLKDLLPAALGKSQYLKNKYSKSLDSLSLTSKNFPTNHVWLKIENEEVINPYKSLPPVFDNWTEEEIENSISEITDINEGGAALTAYGKLQYTDMDQMEIDEITSALLKYCELDTLAMVMLYEHFIELIS